jgi:tetratricopeptide (TPR) repeat protein
VSRVPHRYSPTGSKAIPLLLAAITVMALGTACGGGSSGASASPGTTLNAALKLQQQGKLGDAAQLYQQAIHAQPNNLYAHYDLGVVDQELSNSVGALAAYGAALTINPKYVPALYNEATIYAKTDPVLAISLYRQIVALQPTAPTAYLNLGFLEIQHGEPKQGVAALATAVKQDPTLLSRVPAHLQTLVKALATPDSSPSPHTTPTKSTTSTTSPS